MINKAIAINRKESIDPDGLTFDEQVYIGDSYLDLVINNIENGAWKNEPIVWGSDMDRNSITSSIYFESRDIIFDSLSISIFGDVFDDVIILNNSKNEYIDLLEYKSKYVLRGGLIPHPLPLLTNFSSERVNGDDCVEIEENMGVWCGDKLSIVRDLHKIPQNYINKSDVCFSKDKKEHLARKDKLRQLSAPRDTVVLSSLERIDIRAVKMGVPKSVLVSLLENNDVVELCFAKVSGERVFRLGTIHSDKNFSTSNFNNDDYVFFYDLENNHIKKFLFSNFIGATVVEQ